MGSFSLSTFVFVLWLLIALGKGGAKNGNKHRPMFVFDYNGIDGITDTIDCSIDEETGNVKLYPSIMVTDDDSGIAGMISTVVIRESDQPFTVKFKESTGHIFIEGFQNYTFDAKRMARYTFSLQAWDSGFFPRNSIPLDITCKVISKKKNIMAVNNYTPVFAKTNYIGRITEGKTSHKIIQVLATDHDKDDVFGKICEYFIHEYSKDEGMPFRMNHDGIISLDKPLPKSAPQTYSFVVMAKDCGGRTSEEGALVNVIVDKDCSPGFLAFKDSPRMFKDCGGVTKLTPQISLDSCAQSRLFSKYTAQVKMQTAHILKGCDRETYEASGVHKMCNVNKTIDLLPSQQQGHPWMAALLTDQDIEGENMFEFDGNTSLNVPPEHIIYSGDKKLTLSTWLWMKQSNKKQFIIAATDSKRLDRKHFGLYTQGNQLVFVHRQKSSFGSQVCPSRFTWEPKIFDVKWHHIVITVDGCNAAQLFVDGKEINVVQVKNDWPPHNSNMEQRVVVGACWFGREMKYGDYFHGYLSGLSLNYGETITKEAINCIYQCKEKIKIDTPAPDGFKIQQIGHNMIKISGQGPPDSFEKILQNLVYVNDRRSPTKGQRPIQIHATINKQPLSMITRDIVVDVGVPPEIKVNSGETKVTNVNELRQYGIPIARKLAISATKCLKYLDFARVEVDPPLNTDESLVNPGPLITLLGLKKKQLDNGKGIVIHGLATMEQYQKIMREIVFVNLAPEEGIRHTFKFSFSDLNKRFVSNIMKTELKTLRAINQPQYDMQAVNRQSKDSLPGALRSDVFVTQSTGKSFGTLIGIIVSCSCLFVFLILVIFIRFRSGTASVIYTDVPKKDTEVPAMEEKDVLNVTMNPLEKFEETATKEEVEDKKTENESKPDKMNLEWDDAYIA